MFPLYWPLLEPASALEILACRVVFSLLAIGLLLAVRGGLWRVPRLGRAALTRLTIAGVVIALNWGTYIWGVNHQQVVQTSLGYFINPLVTVALGVIVLHEQLRRVQWVAVALGAVAVAVLTVDGGHVPWLALVLAFSFGTYGLIKKQVGVGAAEGLLVEVGILTIPALATLGVLAGQGTATWLGPHASAGHLLLLVGAGPVTTVPLLFFAGAARRLRLSTLGMLQYLAPVLQFLTGVLIRHEPMPPARLGGFALVWIALVMLTVDAVRSRRAVPAAVAEPEIGDLTASPG